jgi:DNA repair protein RadC
MNYVDLLKKFVSDEQHLSPLENLEYLLIVSGIQSTDVRDISLKLYTEFGGLKNILEQPKQILCKFLAEDVVLNIKFIRKLLSTILEPDYKAKTVLSNPEAVSDYLKAEYGGKQKEVFVALFLNAANELIAKEELFFGTLDQSQVYPRELLKSALLRNASAVILVHNHPSGSLRPSEDDLYITDKLERISSEVQLRVHDHIIVSSNGAYSIKAKRII